jgi:hypothetical protein
LECSDTADSDTDVIPEGDTDDTSEEDATPPLLTLCLTVKRMTMMKTTGKFCHLSNLTFFPPIP